jgi:hypothetical protein
LLLFFIEEGATEKLLYFIMPLKSVYNKSSFLNTGEKLK